MPQFVPGESKTANATMRNPKTVAFDYSAFLYMGTDLVRISGSSFHLNALEEKLISLPVVMPTTLGTYPVYIGVFSSIFDPWSYDADGNGKISMSEALNATNDCTNKKITEAQRDQVIALWQSGAVKPTPWGAGSPTRTLIGLYQATENVVIAVPVPSARLIDYQVALDIACDQMATYRSGDLVVVPGLGSMYAYDALPLLQTLMVQEAIANGLISSSADCYFFPQYPPSYYGFLMYYGNGALIVPLVLPPKLPPPYVCPFCLQAGLSFTDLKYHFSYVHGVRGIPYKCPSCGLWYSIPEALVGHWWARHSFGI